MPSAPRSDVLTCKSLSYNYKTPDNFPQLKDLLGEKDVYPERISRKYKSILQVCFFYFCRISELLRATTRDIIHPDRVIIYGAKHSRSYIIFLPGLTEQLSAKGITDEKTKLWSVTYSQVYRSALKANCFSDKYSGKNNKTTHLARYVFAEKASQITDARTIKDAMRHNSINSQSYYINRKEK